MSVTVMASTGSPNQFVLLSSSNTVSNNDQSVGIPLPGPTDPILQSVLSGFNLNFGSTDHEIAHVGMSVSGQQNLNTGYISVTADMNDASGHHAVDPTASGSLIAWSGVQGSDAGFVVASSARREARRSAAVMC
jgi:hypothetical protein